MHILLTNDDGIDSIGLKMLADAALRRGHTLLISAPKGQCSANSQHISLMGPIRVKKRDWPGAQAYAVEGTPCDCVRLSPNLTDRPIDFCLSGINRGENAGSAVYYSGTVSAAREAAMLYIPAMAVSIQVGADERMLAHLADTAMAMAEKMVKEELPRFTVINLNAPALPPEELKPMVLCPLSQSFYLDRYEQRENEGTADEMHFYLSVDDTSGLPREKIEPGSDFAFLQDGHITCTFLGNFRDFNGIFAEKMQDL